MSTILGEIKKLSNLELGLLCHEYMIHPGHINSATRATIEHRLALAMTKARANERSSDVLKRRSIPTPMTGKTQIPRTTIIPETHKKPSRIPININSRARPQYRGTVSGRLPAVSSSSSANLGSRNSGGRESLEHKTIQKIVQSAKQTPCTSESSNNLEELSDFEPPSPMPTSSALSCQIVDEHLNKTKTSMRHSGGRDRKTRSICEQEIRTINYLSREQEQKLTAERNSTEYLQNLSDVIMSKDKEDSDEGDYTDRHIKRGLLHKMFSFIGLKGKIICRKFRNVVICCGIALFAYVAYRQVDTM